MTSSAFRLSRAVILAAGRGTRLHPLTATRSKAMMPIAGQPLIERVLGTLYHNRVRSFIIVAHPDDGELHRHLDHNLSFPADIQIVHQREQRGMAHALAQAAPLLNAPFVLSACDNLVPPQDIARLFTAWEARQPLAGLLALLPIPEEAIPRSGIVAQDGQRITRIIEKPAIADAPSRTASLPLYVFSPHLLTFLSRIEDSPRGERELQDALQMLINSGARVEGLTVAERQTVTRPADLLAVNHAFLTRPAADHSTPSLPGVIVMPPVAIAPGAHIGRGSTIGPYVTIEDGTQIGPGALIEHAIIMRGGHVPAGAVIRDAIIHP